MRCIEHAWEASQMSIGYKLKDYFLPARQCCSCRLTNKDSTKRSSNVCFTCHRSLLHDCHSLFIQLCKSLLLPRGSDGNAALQDFTEAIVHWGPRDTIEPPYFTRSLLVIFLHKSYSSHEHISLPAKMLSSSEIGQQVELQATLKLNPKTLDKRLYEGRTT